MSISKLIGLTLTEVRNDDNAEILFVASDGRRFKLYHEQDCCESVNVEDICGDLSDLIGAPILSAEVSTSDSDPSGYPAREYIPDSLTWTFYKLSTIKGSVTIRWYGESNGYCSESVTFEEISP